VAAIGNGRLSVRWRCARVRVCVGGRVRICLCEHGMVTATITIDALSCAVLDPTTMSALASPRVSVERDDGVGVLGGARGKIPAAMALT